MTIRNFVLAFSILIIVSCSNEEFKTKAVSKNTEIKDNYKMDIKKKLTPLQYKVTMENGTEPPFQNKYWDNKKEGVYVDIISKKVLFLSTEKFDSKTGWPSFFNTVDKDEVVEIEDNTHGMTRVEVRSKTSNSHLGHLFNDGPAPTGKRYCINSASLNFIAKEDLEKNELGDYLKFFK